MRPHVLKHTVRDAVAAGQQPDFSANSAMSGDGNVITVYDSATKAIYVHEKDSKGTAFKMVQVRRDVKRGVCKHGRRGRTCYCNY